MAATPLSINFRSRLKRRLHRLARPRSHHGPNPMRQQTTQHLHPILANATHPCGPSTPPMPSALPYPDPAACAPEAFRAALADLVQCGLIVAHMVARRSPVRNRPGRDSIGRNGGRGRVPPRRLPRRSHRGGSRVGRRPRGPAHHRRPHPGHRRRLRPNRPPPSAARSSWPSGWTAAGPAPPTPTQARPWPGVTSPAPSPTPSSAMPNRSGRDRLIEALADRLDAPDTLDDVATRPAEDIIRDICRDLGLDPARMPPATPRGSPVPDTAPAPMTPARRHGAAATAHRAPPARASPGTPLTALNLHGRSSHRSPG